MTSVNPNSGVNTNYYQQGAGGPQPTTYVPGANNSYRPDQFQQNRPQQQGGGLGGLLNNANNKPYVTKQSVMTGLTGAAAGFMIGGPMGALIGGIIGLLLSVIMNIVNMNKASKNPVPQQPMQIYPNQQGQMPNNSAQQQYQQRLQQQQNQQMAQYQQQQQNQQQGQYNQYNQGK